MEVPEPPLFVKLFNFTVGLLFVIESIVCIVRGSYGVAAFLAIVGLAAVSHTIYLGRKYGFIGQFRKGAY